MEYMEYDMEAVPTANFSQLFLPNASQPNFTFDVFQSPLHVPYLRTLFIIFYVLVFGLCVVGNLMVLIIMAKHARLRTRTNFFLGNLAAADLCVGLLCVLPNLTTFLSPTWILGTVMCKVYHFVENMSYTTSVLLLATVAWERFIAIRHPLRARQWFTTTRLKVAQTGIWMAGFAWNIPYLIVFRTMFIRDASGTATFCYMDHQLDMRLYSTLNFVVWYLLPLAVLVAVYSSISLTLWRTTRQHQLAVTNNHLRGSIHALSASYKCHTQVVHMHRSDAPQQGDEDSLTRGQISSHSSSSSSSSNTCKKHGAGRGCLGGVAHNDDGHAHSELHGATPTCNGRQMRGMLGGTGARGKGGLPFRRGQALAWNLSPCLQTRFKSTSSSSSSDDKGLQPRQACHYRLNSQSLLKSRRRVIRLLIAVIVSFAVCVLPHRVRLLMHVWEMLPAPGPGTALLSPCSFLLLYLNSALNPILYWLFSQSFRRSFLDCCLYRCRRLPRSQSALGINVRGEAPM